MRMMDSYCVALILGFVTALLINGSSGIYHQRTIRALDYPAQWRPLAVPAQNEHLISIANFDSTNNAQLAQIAHHNAQILRQIKGLHPPITQYHNPYPLFASGHGSGKNVFVHTNIIHPSLPDSSTNNLLTSSSNVAQTIVPHNMKHTFVSPKPSYLGKVEMNSPYKFLNSIHSSTAKIPGLIKSSVSMQPSYPIYASTTSRVPIIRDVTLTPPPSYRTTPKSHSVANKLNAHLALPSRSKAPVMAASNTFDAFSIPGQILSSFTHFAQPSHVIRDNKPRVSNNFLNYQIEQPFSNSFTGHLVPAGHFVSKNPFPGAVRFPQNSISSVYSPHVQHTVHLKHPSQQLQPVQQQSSTQNQHSNVQQPAQYETYEKPKEQQHLTESFHTQSISHGSSNQETENQYRKPSAEATDNDSNKDGSYLPPLPSVPPSVLSPFFQHVQQQQQQQYQHSTTTEPSNQPKDYNNYPNAFDLYKNSQDVQFSNFKALENEFTHNLVPPPFKHKDASQYRDKAPASSSPSYLDVEQIKAIDILNKYNIPAISPLQDANRYAYKSRPNPPTETPNVPRPTEHQFGTSATFTTEKPNIFQNLNRPSESEYKQHKLMHPSYTGAKRPVHSTNQPFLPTPHSHDVAITHSFFTIEDAITLSPKHSYRPIVPTNTDQIEDIIRKPAEEEITEVITLSPVNNDLQDDARETSPNPIMETSSSTRLRGRGNKIRRRKPKPSTEANDDIQGQWEMVKVDNSQKEHRQSNYNEAVVEESPKDEMMENAGNFNRNRHRTRPTNTSPTAVESNVNEKPSRGRRPLNKSRHRTSSLPTSTGEGVDNNEHTTTDSNVNPFILNNSYKHRRPSTTLQTFSSPSAPQNVFRDAETTDPATVIADIQTNQPMRTRVYTTAMANHNVNSVSTETLPVNSIVRQPEENSVVVSTKAAFSDIPLITNAPESETTIHYRQNTFPVEETVAPTSTSTTTTTTLKSPEDVSEKSGLDHVRNRQRLRYKDKLKDVFSSTTSSSSTTTEISIEKTVQDNEVTDNRVNVRLPIVTSSSTKVSDDDDAITAPTLSTNKLNRLNSMNKFESRNRPRFSVKDYRQRLSTSTTTEQTSPVTESTTLATTRLRFPTRTRLLPDLKKSVEKLPKSQDTAKPVDESSNVSNKPESSETTEVSSESTRKRFSPKDRYSSRVKSTENPSSSTTTNRPTTRNRGNTRRDFGNKARQSSTTPIPIERTVSRSPVIRNSTYPLRRPQNVSLRQRIQNHYKTTKEPTSSNEVDSQADMTMENKSDEIMSTEDYKHETAIMKIAKDDHSYRPYKASDEMNYNDGDNDLNGSPSEQSERVAELAIFDNNFNSVHTGSASRRVPGYFTIATEDPILPIEAFFPQLKRD